ncbi:MAG: copper chaperone PCu(A)C [Neisseriaceae bacterium]|nr:copper chaperone PCu(A)C [Neisseriaceae bacterium]
MKKTFLALLTASVFTFANAGELTIDHPYSRITAPKVKTGAVFMNINNDTNENEVLLSAKTSVAGRTEIHRTTVTNDGVMQMRPIDHLEIVKGESVALMPGGLHIMLLNLKKPLIAGDEFDVTLNFKKAGKKTVKVKVIDQAAPAMHHHHH